MTVNITIQGIRGCFHEAAAIEYFSRAMPEATVSPVECATFEEMLSRLDKDSSLLGIMAIENTIAGPLLQNHELLRSSHLNIIGEHKMRISHSLASLPGQTLDEIKEISSHPMAIMQCWRYLSSLPQVKISEAFDTAGSAAEIAASQSPGKAAICSSLAANIYGLDILADAIETNKRNFTRFLILSHQLTASRYAPNRADKASLVFTLPHAQGALSKVLTILSFYDTNLTKIQSTPILGKEWEYRFYIDLTFSDYDKYRQAVEAVRPLTSQLRILGEYSQCMNPV